MKSVQRMMVVLAILLLLGLALGGQRLMLAHEDRPVGPYNFHVGWHVEPALVDQLNAVELTLTTSADNKPVTGAEKNLTVTISTRGQTSQALTFDPSDESPGLYTASIIPTLTGDYQFHFVGMVGTTKVDETFDTAKGQINSVEPINDLEFPNKPPTNEDLQKEIDALKAQIAALKGGTAPTAAAAASQ
jgi:hypothetical protein